VVTNAAAMEVKPGGGMSSVSVLAVSPLSSVGNRVKKQPTPGRYFHVNEMAAMRPAVRPERNKR